MSLCFCSPVILMHRRARLLKQQTSFTVYYLATKENNLPFYVHIFIYGKQNYMYLLYIYDLYIHIHILININKHIHIYAAVLNGKQKPRHFSLIRVPFAHRKNRSLSIVRLLTKKQTEIIRLPTDYTD